MQYVGEERRNSAERRRHTLAAHVLGGLNPRRFKPRRVTDRIYPIIDWHAPRVLAAVVAILALCVVDGIATILLISQGAVEVNPFMALFLPDSLAAFAAVKLLLTAAGIMVLAACSQMRLLRLIPGEWVLYGVLASYVLLVGYEWRLLEGIY
jgi:hypothetical protein